MWITWREAMRSALYGPAGFYASGEPPARHFRTSVHVSARFGEALLTVLQGVDAALGHPDRLDLVDVGAGRGELLSQILTAADRDRALARRIVPHAVEIVPAPAGLDPRIRWRAEVPTRISGLVVANEWLDNVPLDVAELAGDGPHLVQVDPVSGAERAGPLAAGADRDWLRAWWPLRMPGDRAEIGWPRCQAWAQVVGALTRGLAIAVDYWHDRSTRPPQGTLSSYRHGRPVPVIPDGSRDVTAHVALDACAHAGRAAGAQASLLTSQARVLRALGISGQRPSPALALADPGGYARALQAAGHDGELVDPDGLGGFGWLIQMVGMDWPDPLAALAAGVGAVPDMAR